MSSKISNLICRQQYVLRLTEICGSPQPAEVARKLGISYQAAKNYLGGRLPDSSVLLLIAEQTPYSIHWLLTGSGDKLVEQSPVDLKDAALPADRIRNSVRAEMRLFLSEILNQSSAENDESENSLPVRAAEIPSSRVVRLKTSEIKNETNPQNSDIFAGREIDGQGAD